MIFELTWLDLGLIIVLAYAWGRWTQWRINMHNLLNNPQGIANILSKYAEVKDVDDKPQLEVEVRVEWHEDQCYIYRVQTLPLLLQPLTAVNTRATSSSLKIWLQNPNKLNHNTSTSRLTLL